MWCIYLVMVQERLWPVRVEEAWTLLNVVIDIILFSVEAQSK